MNKLKSVIRYIVNNYPYSYELTKTRTTKLVYLVDLYSCRKYKHQITNIKWMFDHYGPYVSDVFDEVDKDDLLEVEMKQSNFGTIKYILKSKDSDTKLDYELSNEEQEIINNVIEDTKSLYWTQFIEFVYNTNPVKNGDRYCELNLIEK